MTFSMKKVKEMKHMKFGDRPSIGRRGFAATPAAAGGRQIDGRSFMSFIAFMIFTSSPLRGGAAFPVGSRAEETSSCLGSSC